ncbi:MAG: dynamin family protein [Betaproteobacteria bacterium]|nr:dynamin family protein [Betaproteobacteria bacterium]
MTSQLEKEVAQYQEWRDQMVAGIESYKSWLDTNGYADIQQSLRIYDLIESLRNDRMTLAFLAEFSRGKTELINAMFFSDFKQRLLPSNVGRTTMCPTEIFHDPAEEPYIRLLPIETRKRQESVSALKRQPVEWVKIRLNVDSREETTQAMQHLVEVKTVSIEEAKSLGLWDDTDPMATTVVIKDGDRVDIPSWRHAMISYPHPLLKSGLVVLDTPGLNALGTEPELTLSIIPNAHAVLFLLAIDTGVTKSDLDVWQKYVQTAATRRIAVLNKIDLMWDDLKSGDEIAGDVERQLEATSMLLTLPRTHVLALSAQKALLARIRGDDALLTRSGIAQLEQLLASEIIPAKQEIMRAAVQREIGSMVDASRLAVANQLAATRTELKELAAMSGKSRSMAQAMVTRLEADRKKYHATVQTFRNTYNTVMNQGATLLKQLDEGPLEAILNKDHEFIKGAWTTAGLWKNMQALFQHFTGVSKKILNFANQIKGLVDATYAHFHEKFGFARLSPPALNLEKHTLTMTGLQETARQFCHDPINVMTEKHFLVAKFYDGLVAEARQIFEMTRVDAEAWLKSALGPLNLQIKDHEQVLSRRIENFKKIRDNISSVEDRMKQVEKLQATLQQQSRVLARIKAALDGEDIVATPPVIQREAATMA